MTTQRSLLGISAIARNEAPYLLEWIAHHRLLGVERFFLVDDRSSDGTTEVLAAMESAGLVKCVPFSVPPGEKPQVPAYRLMLRSFRHEVDWMAFIDVDEYMWPMGEEIRMDRFLQRIPPQIGAIALNWAVFGSSGHRHYAAAPTPERFTWHADHRNPINHQFKTVVRTHCASDFTCPHNAIVDAPWTHVHTDLLPKRTLIDSASHSASDAISWEAFRLNHYVIRSWEEFVAKKSKRGRAFTDFPLDRHFYEHHDIADEQTLPSRSYLSSLEKEMAALRAQMPSIEWDRLWPTM